MFAAKTTEETNFVLIRVLFYCGMATVHSMTDVSRLSRWLPLNGPLLYPWIPSELLNYEAMLIFKWLFVLACLICGAGWRFRFFAPGAAIFGFLYLLLGYAAGMSNHQNQLPALILILFAIQALFPNQISKLQIRFLMRLSFCLVFLTAGLSKVAELGIDWFDGQLHLSYLLLNRFSYRPPFGGEFFDLNLYFIKNHELLKPAFYAALPLELLAPLALWRPMRFLIIVFAIMQVFAALTLYAVFTPYIPVYAVWVGDHGPAKFFEESLSSLREKLGRVLKVET